MANEYNSSYTGIQIDTAVGKVLNDEVGGGKTTGRTIVVGTSTAGWTAKDCDYLCDGVNDQVEIVAAIDELLPDQDGTVLLLEGIYNIEEDIEKYFDEEFHTTAITNKLTLCGTGKGTVLQGPEDMQVIYIETKNFTIRDMAINLIDIMFVDNCEHILVSDIDFHDSKISFPYDTSNITIKNNTFTGEILGAIDVSYSNNIKILNNILIGDGIEPEDGIRLNDVNEVTISDNHIKDVLNGIFIEESEHITITSNQIKDSNDGIFMLDSNYVSISNNIISSVKNNSRGIYMRESNDCKVSNNILSDNSHSGILMIFGGERNIFSNNICNNHKWYGIYFESPGYNCIVTGNTCMNNDVGGLSLRGDHNVVSNNNCVRGNGAPEDYIDEWDDEIYTIFLSGDYNTITNNNCFGKAPDVTGTGNTVFNNKVDSGDDFSSHLADIATTDVIGHVKIGTTSTTASAGNHNHSGVYEPVNTNIIKKNTATILAAIFTAQNNTSYTTKQIRNITLSTADPSGGANGDIWIKYK